MPDLDLSQIFLYADVDRRMLVTSDRVPLAGEDILSLYREEIVILCITCIDNDGAAVGYAATNTFELGVAQDYDEDTDVLCLSEDAQFNISGDWDDADATAGKLSVRLNTYTEEFDTHLGTTQSKQDGRIYLRKFGASVANTLCDYSCELRNIARPSGAVPAGVTSPTYRTAAAQDIIDATLLAAVGSSDIEITDATKGIIFLNAAGERRRMTVDNYANINISDAL